MLNGQLSKAMKLLDAEGLGIARVSTVETRNVCRTKINEDAEMLDFKDWKQRCDANAKATLTFTGANVKSLFVGQEGKKAAVDVHAGSGVSGLSLWHMQQMLQCAIVGKRVAAGLAELFNDWAAGGGCGEMVPLLLMGKGGIGADVPEAGMEQDYKRVFAAENTEVRLFLKLVMIKMETMYPGKDIFKHTNYGGTGFSSGAECFIAATVNGGFESTRENKRVTMMVDIVNMYYAADRREVMKMVWFKYPEMARVLPFILTGRVLSFFGGEENAVFE